MLARWFSKHAATNRLDNMVVLSGGRVSAELRKIYEHLGGMVYDRLCPGLFGVGHRANWMWLIADSN